MHIQVADVPEETIMEIKRVWIIEDNAPDVFLINMALERTKLPFERTVMSDGEDAMRNLERCAAGTLPPPHLMLLDLHLPKVQGADLLGMVQGNALLARTCLAILSSLPEPVTGVHLRPSDRYIQKSPHLNEFVARIVAWVNICLSMAV